MHALGAAVGPVAGDEAPGLWARSRRQAYEEITAVAMDLFLAEGFEQTTIDRIAAAAGISRRCWTTTTARSTPSVEPEPPRRNGGPASGRPRGAAGRGRGYRYPQQMVKESSGKSGTSS
nr:TetR/AcrR family transcriptional regulator [Glycomyces sp. TRM65418]